MRLPLLLRPTTYPFSRPVSIVVIALLPIAVPLSVAFLIARFLVQGRDSKRRIREWREKTDATTTGGGGGGGTRAKGRGREGMLERVGVRVREVAEQVGTDNPEYAENLSSSTLADDDDEEAEEGDSLLVSNRLTTREPRRRQAGEEAWTNPVGSTTTSGESTPTLLRGGSPPRNLSHNNDDDDDNTTTRTRTEGGEAADHDHDRKVFPNTDPVLTASQRFQLENLNRLDRLRKHFVYLPESRNSHGAIVRRSPEWEQHRIGTKVVDFWAREFVF